MKRDNHYTEKYFKKQHKKSIIRKICYIILLILIYLILKVSGILN